MKTDFKIFIQKNKNTALSNKVNDDQVFTFKEAAEQPGAFRIESHKYPKFKLASHPDGECYAYNGEETWKDQIYSFTPVEGSEGYFHINNKISECGLQVKYETENKSYSNKYTCAKKPEGPASEWKLVAYDESKTVNNEKKQVKEEKQKNEVVAKVTNNKKSDAKENAKQTEKKVKVVEKDVKKEVKAKEIETKKVEEKQPQEKQGEGQKPEEKIKEKTDEKPVKTNEPASNIIAKMKKKNEQSVTDEQPAEKADEKEADEQPIEKTEEKVAAKPVEQATEKVAEKEIEQEAEKQGDEVAEKPEEEEPEQPAKETAPTAPEEKPVSTAEKKTAPLSKQVIVNPKKIQEMKVLAK